MLEYRLHEFKQIPKWFGRLQWELDLTLQVNNCTSLACCLYAYFIELGAICLPCASICRCLFSAIVLWRQSCIANPPFHYSGIAEHKALLQVLVEFG